MSRQRWLVQGRVQGVGFRAFVAQQAAKLGLSGTVRNLADGRVEVVVEGDQPVVEQFKALVAAGPRMARVTNVENADILVDVTVAKGFTII